MKYAQFAYLFFLSPFAGLHAQNWMPVLPGEIQHYRLAGASHLTHSLRIDSAAAKGADSIFYLNRVLEWVPTTGSGDTSYVALRDQGQFLGQSMTRKPDGSLVFNTERPGFDTTIVLMPQAAEGDHWVAEPKAPVVATVASVTAGLVLGEPDSLKTIQFDNGAGWVLSKNHGLVRCVDFVHNGTVELSGLENRQLGDRLYRFDDFFDFQTGDIFQFETFNSGLSGFATTYSRRRILNKSILGDTLRYTAERQWKRVRIGWMAGTTYGVDTFHWDFVRADLSRVSNYPGQLYAITGIFFTPYNRFSATEFRADSLLIGSPDYYNPASAEPAYCSVLQPADPSTAALPGEMACALEEYREIYRPGLGRTFSLISYFDNFEQEELVGAVVQGDTTGTLDPGWLFTAVQAPAAQPIALRAFPNPASGRLFLSAATPLPGEVRISLSDALGRTARQIETQAWAGEYELDLSGLLPGAYLLTVRWASGWWSGKVWIAR